MATQTNLAVAEAEAVKYGVTTVVTPGPGHYDSFTDGIATIDYSFTSIEGSFPKESRKIEKTFLTGSSPGPIYNPPQGIAHSRKGPVFSKASRFGNDKPNVGHLSPLKGEAPDKKAASAVIGTAPRFPEEWKRKDLRPGYTYGGGSLLKQTGKHTGPTIPQSKRWLDPEEDSTPGPVYNPKVNTIGKTTVGPKIPLAERFPAPKTQDAPPPIDSKPLPKAPAYSFGTKPVAWTKVESPSPGPKYDTQSSWLATHPTHAFSFAAPDASHNTDHQNVAKTVKSKGGNEKEKKRAASPAKQHTVVENAIGQDSPGPAQYLNIYKLFEEKPAPKSFTISGPKLRPQARSATPGPLDYNVLGSKKKTGACTFGTAKRETFPLNKDSPGPIYDNDKWTKRTPVHHGVATQTTNYTAKAEARRKAELEAKQKQDVQYHLALLHNEFPTESEEEHLPAWYTQATLRDLPTHKDKFLVNVWY